MERSLEQKKSEISITDVNRVYAETMGLLGSMQVKGNVDIEKELIRIMNDNEMSLENKFNSIKTTHKEVFNMIHGDGRSSDYR
jgi:hypothetical protein